MAAFKHRAVSFGTPDVPPPDVASSIGPISLHNAIEPRTDDEAEKDLVRAVANARTSVRDALAGEHPGTAGGVGGH